MKLDCYKRAREQIEKYSQWHPWFAWYPVQVGKEDCRFMENVWRKGVYYGKYSGWFWKHKPMVNMSEPPKEEG